jgi:hypothetical protein
MSCHVDNVLGERDHASPGYGGPCMSRRTSQDRDMRRGDAGPAAWKPPPLFRLSPDELPLALFRSFKAELGEANAHLCIVDAALRDLAKGHLSSSNKTEFLREHTRIHGHRHLATDKLRFEFALHLAYMSQVALLLTRLECLCDSIAGHSLVNQQIKDRLKGDFVRRALWLVAASRESSLPVSPIDDNTAQRYVGELDLAVVDSYRIMRNLELHAATSAVPKDGTLAPNAPNPPEAPTHGFRLNA